MTIHNETITQKFGVKQRERTRDGGISIDHELNFTVSVTVRHPPIQSYRTRPFNIQRLIYGGDNPARDYWSYNVNILAGMSITASSNQSPNHDIDCWSVSAIGGFFENNANGNYIPELNHSHAYGFNHRIPGVALEGMMAVLDLLCQDAGLTGYEPFRIYDGVAEDSFTTPTLQRTYTLVQFSPTLFQAYLSDKETSELYGLPFCIKDIYRQIQERLTFYFRGIGMTDFVNAQGFSYSGSLVLKGEAAELITTRETPMRIRQTVLPRLVGSNNVLNPVRPDMEARFYKDRTRIDFDNFAESGHISVTELLPLFPYNDVGIGTRTPYTIVLMEDGESDGSPLPSGAVPFTHAEFGTTCDVDLSGDTYSSVGGPVFTGSGPPYSEGIQTLNKGILYNGSSCYSSAIGTIFSSHVDGPVTDYMLRGSIKSVSYGVHLAGRTFRQMAGLRVLDSRVKLTRKLYGPMVDFNGINLGPIGFSAQVNTITCTVSFVTDVTLFPKTSGLSPFLGVYGNVTSGTIIGSASAGDAYLNIPAANFDAIMDTPACVMYVTFSTDVQTLDPDADTPLAMLNYNITNGRRLLNNGSGFGGTGIPRMVGTAGYTEQYWIEPDTVNTGNICEFRFGPLGIRHLGATYEQ